MAAEPKMETQYIAGAVVGHLTADSINGTDSGLHSIASVSQIGAIVPVTLFSSEDTVLNPSGIINTIQKFRTTDDVFSDYFLTGHVLVQSAELVTREQVFREFIGTISGGSDQWLVQRVDLVAYDSVKSSLPSGPYFLEGPLVRKAYRLYGDSLESFQAAVLPAEDGGDYSFVELHKPIRKNNGAWIQSIAVPSRCYSKPTKDKPLSGVRVSVKDNYALAGLKTGNQNKAFFATYEPEQESAEYVKRLIDLGAVIVGKTKLSSFASSEKPCDWWEFQCPFNARGDGQLNPGQSTTGGATAAGGYDWLDISIGSDTFGSVREPAAQNAVYGIRFSTDVAVPMGGVYPSSPVFDVIGILGRDLAAFSTFAKSTVNSVIRTYDKWPQRILYPTDFFPSGEKAQQQFWDGFVTVLEDFLGVKKESISIEQTWNDEPPAAAAGRDYKTFTKYLAANPFYYDGYHEYEYFRADHLAKFGTKAYVSPHMQWKWDIGANLSKSDYEQSKKDIVLFRKWFDTKIMGKSSGSGTDAILVLPVGPGAPVYRDQFVVPTPRLGLDALNLAAALALPHAVFPIGQVPYDSPKSGRKEYLPIAGSIAGASGSDLVLIDLVHRALMKAVWPTTIKAGRTAFDDDRTLDMSVTAQVAMLGVVGSEDLTDTKLVQQQKN
ncbi:amidase signature enzyme [Pseudovirgaria hyperparasitica]|uniref:Amidase signature enzyme n=1 Tax=Pseudovirgaria hyperparasitica TaxID=470096 RepID=A0A6A6WJC9_9PEZI|nr:amidase signature enzyme [Pseudovirgaria hyperparasitica]KAF2762286.1 amidase signature enzyme [Pseudovirgaria hyperparasitica]